MRRFRLWLAKRFYRAGFAVDPCMSYEVQVGWTDDFSIRVLEMKCGVLRLRIPVNDEEAKDVAECLLMEEWEARVVARPDKQ